MMITTRMFLLGLNVKVLILGKIEMKAITRRLEEFSGRLGHISLIDKFNRAIAQKQNIHEDELTAYHEAGHVLLQYLLQPNHQPVKTTIIPTSSTEGYAHDDMTTPNSGTKTEYINDMAINFGGYCAEMIHIGETTNGCLSDMNNAKETAKNMVRMWNMGGVNVPHTDFDFDKNDLKIFGLPIWSHTTSTQRPFSPETLQQIERAEQKLVAQAQRKAMRLLKENEPALHALAKELVEKRTLLRAEIKTIIEENTDERPDMRKGYGEELDL
ncbi:MAG: hypothetical protein ACLFR0_08765 [Alphaproteobacteria bacterium]